MLINRRGFGVFQAIVNWVQLRIAISDYNKKQSFETDRQ